MHQSNKHHNQSIKSGLPPGSLVLIGQETNHPIIEVGTYTQEKFDFRYLDQLSQIELDETAVNWIHIAGLNTTMIEELGQQFDLHNLVLEDILNTSQRPKVDEFESYVYFVLRVVKYVDNVLVTEQISFILGENFVISIEEKNTGIFTPIKERIIHKKGNVRCNKADYLLYILIDLMVDNFYAIMEKVEGRIEETQKNLENPDQDQRPLILLRNLKKDVLQLRKNIVPTREAVYKLERLETLLILENTDKYLRDLYDHTKQIEDAIEAFNDAINNFREDYMSYLTLKTNKIIQILTIISSIFIPLTFIVGVYGMNFDFIPGLHWKYGFVSSLVMMVFITVVMIFVYRRNRWL